MPRVCAPEWAEARRNEWAGEFTGNGQRQAFLTMDKAMCRELSLDETLPKWLQLAYHAYAMVSRYQSEYFPRRGEVAGFLGVRPGDESRHISQAIAKGFLAPGSSKDCLILPGGVSYYRREYRITDPEANTAATVGRSLLTDTA